MLSSPQIAYFLKPSIFLSQIKVNQNGCQRQSLGQKFNLSYQKHVFCMSFYSILSPYEALLNNGYVGIKHEGCSKLPKTRFYMNFNDFEQLLIFDPHEPIAPNGVIVQNITHKIKFG